MVPLTRNESVVMLYVFSTERVDEILYISYMRPESISYFRLYMLLIHMYLQHIYHSINEFFAVGF